MGKSGKINRFEPTDTSWAIKFPECATLFRIAGWLSFFENITGFNSEVSHHFSQNFINEIVTLNTLRFELTEYLIDEATGVQIGGESQFKKSLLALTLIIFYYHEMKPQIGAKGFNQKKLSQNGKKQLVLYIIILHTMAGLHQYLNTTLYFYNI